MNKFITLNIIKVIKGATIFQNSSGNIIFHDTYTYIYDIYDYTKKQIKRRFIKNRGNFGITIMKYIK